MAGTAKVWLAGLVVAGVAGSYNAAFAADDGYDNVFSSVLTAVGLLKPDESAPIDYRERAPLVLPPKDDLTKPVAPGKARTAAWPQDPDVLKRQKAAELARAPSPNLLGNPNALASKQALMEGRTAGSGPVESARRHDDCGNDGNRRGCLVLSPDQLREDHERYVASGGGESDHKEIVAGDEPDRVYLTQPPKGYMRVTRTVKATTEAPKVYHDESNPASQLVYRPKEDE